MPRAGEARREVPGGMVFAGFSLGALPPLLWLSDMVMDTLFPAAGDLVASREGLHRVMPAASG